MLSVAAIVYNYVVQELPYIWILPIAYGICGVALSFELIFRIVNINEKKVAYLEQKVKFWNNISYRVKNAGETSFNEMPIGIIVFDDNFKILSNGENDSAYIITEKRINYILNLFTKSPKMCIFYDGPASSMYIMLEGKKLIKAPSSDGNMQDTTRKALERLHSIEQHIISLM